MSALDADRVDPDSILVRLPPTMVHRVISSKRGWLIVTNVHDGMARHSLVHAIASVATLKWLRHGAELNLISCPRPYVGRSRFDAAAGARLSIGRADRTHARVQEGSRVGEPNRRRPCSSRSSHPKRHQLECADCLVTTASHYLRVCAVATGRCSDNSWWSTAGQAYDGACFVNGQGPRRRT